MTFGQLADLVEERLAESDRAAVEARAGDDESQRTLRWLRGFLGTARSVPLAESSPLVEQRLRQHFTRWTQARELLSADTLRLRAELRFDSRRDRPLAGVRGGGGTVELVYGAEAGELVITVLPSTRDTVRVLGQVLLENDTAAPVFEVRAGSGGAWTRTESDAYGRFRLDGLATGPTELRVSNGEVEIAATVELGQPDGPE